MPRLARVFAICMSCSSLLVQGCEAVSPAGKGVPDAAADGEVEDAGACAPDGEDCTDRACCGELECTALNDGPLTCHAACASDVDCDSGCCVSVRGDAPRKLCGAAEICFPNGCEQEGRSCGGDTPCCAGLSCVTGAMPASRNGCRTRCERNEDCDSGCCTLFRDRSDGFCDDALYCTCIEPGEACSAEVRSCCDGSRCARFGDEAFSCLPTCGSSEDCGGNCCSPIEGGDDVCAPFPC